MQTLGKFNTGQAGALKVRQRFTEENMRASIVHTMSRSIPVAVIGAWVAVSAPVSATLRYSRPRGAL
jgi:hypothetical protein